MLRIKNITQSPILERVKQKVKGKRKVRRHRHDELVFVVHTTDRYTSRPDVRMATWPSQPLRTDVGMIDIASGHLGGQYVRMRTWPSGPPGPRYVRMGNLTFVRIIRGPEQCLSNEGSRTWFY